MFKNRRSGKKMRKVDIKEELAVQAVVAENNEQDGNVRLTKSMSIKDMVKAGWLEHCF